MTEKIVVPIRPGTPLPELSQAEPNERVISLLEDLLEEARAGLIQGIACAYLDDTWSAAYSIVGSVGGYSLQGAISCVATELAHINMAHAERSHE